jgi:hypothetical protein
MAVSNVHAFSFKARQRLGFSLADQKKLNHRDTTIAKKNNRGENRGKDAGGKQSV